MCVRKTREQFMSEFFDLFGDNYEIPNLQYVNSLTKITVFCKRHCHYTVKSPKKIFSTGIPCRLCGKEKIAVHLREKWKEGKDWFKDTTTMQERENTVNNISNDLVSIFQYNGSSTQKTIFKCEITGELFSYRYYLFIKDGKCRCESCKEYNKEVDRWRVYFRRIFLANIKHEGKYRYDLEAGFIKGETIRAFCDIHGEFYPDSKAHYKNLTGCPSCAREYLAYTGGYNRIFNTYTKEHHEDTESRVYLLKITHGSGSCYKVGVTSRQLQARLRDMKYSHPEVSQIEILSSHTFDIQRSLQIEKEMLDTYRTEYSVTSLQGMSGWTECFTHDNPDSLVTHFKSLISE